MTTSIRLAAAGSTACPIGTWITASFTVPSSNHPGGVNVLFADGGVRFVKDGIDRMVWWSLGTKAGGEVVSGDQY